MNDDKSLGRNFLILSIADDPSNVTDAFLDTSNRRLITTQTSGYTRAWNYNNGQLLRTFNKGTSKEVVAGVYVQQGTYKYAYY
jgi:hypothetical protein